MRLSIEQKALLKSLNNLQAIVEKRNAIPILSNIKVEAEGGKLILTATDMDMVATDILSAEIQKGGVLTLPAQKLYDIVRKLPSGEVVDFTLEEDGRQMRIVSGDANFKVSCLSADDFPIMEKGEVVTGFGITGADLLHLIGNSQFAMSREETRYYLNGVYLHQFEKKIRAVATDGHRLARIDSSLPADANGMEGIIIPRKTVSELKKLLEQNNQAEVKVELSNNKINFEFGDITLLSKVIDGSFPDYARAIPSGNSKNIELNREHLTNAVDRVATISSDKTRSIKFSFSGNVLTLSASAEADSAKETFEVNYSGDDFAIGFNANYTLEMLRQFKGDIVHMSLEDANSPAIVKDSADEASLYVLMPMRF